MTRTMTETTAAMLLSLFLFITPGAAFAEMGGGPDGKGGPGKHERGGQEGPGNMFKELNLTEEQEQKLKELREAGRDGSKASREEMKAAHEKMRELLEGDANESQLRAQHKKLQALKMKMDDERFENMLATRAILTPEQRKKMAEQMKERHGKRGGDRGPRH